MFNKIKLIFTQHWLEEIYSDTEKNHHLISLSGRTAGFQRFSRAKCPSSMIVPLQVIRTSLAVTGQWQPSCGRYVTTSAICKRPQMVHLHISHSLVLAAPVMNMAAMLLNSV
jgi:hypothetical protein